MRSKIAITFLPSLLWFLNLSFLFILSTTIIPHSEQLKMKMRDVLSPFKVIFRLTS